ncbi:hypothetical protein HYPSUDRAFT_32706 [Hypholoma sublateritium FD-334 SS-4]|uniref:SH3 domain-containing protein n=1 Tax=Hypholoma sublateritium (strain FD-334 SS-4) TaxID=945553 RepID=A0A0D2LMP6_HYPSF|nr:hypothetical protein HYPSUDRAFT_32706 [Hypholoma sublateritium FD-334 SS-4]
MKLMKLANPLPQPLPKECEKAARIFKSFVDNGNNGLDGVIPRSILENAKGFAVFTIVKAGFVFSARAGSGIVIARLDNGSWSAPSAIGTAGLGLGGQAGAEMTDFLIVLNSRSAIRSFMAAGSLSLGGNMSIALGPLGRTGEASGALNTNGKVAAMYSYSKTRGLFGGISIEGSVIVERQDANVQAYNSDVTARLLLGGALDPPPWASPLIKTLEACVGMPGGREWVQEDVPQTPGGSPYAFGGLSSPSSSRAPSFLRKKKKADPAEFPPTSWGEETSSGSYFSDSSKSHSRNITWDGGKRSKFDTTFESDFSPSPQPVSQRSSEDGINPFATTTSTPSFGATKPFSPLPRSDFQSNPPDSAHSRTFSLDQYRAPSLASKYSNDFRSNAATSPSLGKATQSATVPLIKPREELTRPLPPDEGIARAIALYNFSAVEAGDLSFGKGDVIVITKKSNSSDDWWTGKVNGRQGIFPANFVELV